MNNCTKRIFAIILTLCVCTVPLRSLSVSASSEVVMPLYNNVSNATANSNVTDNGKLSINYKYVGNSQVTTKAVITTYIEKKVLGLLWSRVDIGTSDNQWTDTINNYKYTGSRTYKLPSSGTYRITVKFKIYGTGGTADNIEKQMTVSY